MVWIWLCIIIVLTIIEILTVNLTTVWFVASAFIALICSIFIDSFFIQFGVFVIVGIILLLSTRKYLLKVIEGNKESTNLDRIIGMKGVVTQEIKKNSTGEVKVDGKYWTAISDKKIDVNNLVEVLSINGVKIKVKEVDE